MKKLLRCALLVLLVPWLALTARGSVHVTNDTPGVIRTVTIHSLLWESSDWGYWEEEDWFDVTLYYGESYDSDDYGGSDPSWGCVWAYEETVAGISESPDPSYVEEVWTGFDDPQGWDYGEWDTDGSGTWEDEQVLRTRTNSQWHYTGEESNLGGIRNEGSYLESEDESEWIDGTRPLNWVAIDDVVDDWHEIDRSPDSSEYWEDDWFWQDYTLMRTRYVGWHNDRDGDVDTDYVDDYYDDTDWVQGTRSLEWNYYDYISGEEVLVDWNPDPSGYPFNQPFTQHRTVRYDHVFGWNNLRDGDIDDGTYSETDDESRIAYGTGASPVITSSSTATGIYGAAFSYAIAATNSPTSYGAEGLPGGLSVSGDVISGAPTATGDFNVSLSATNAFGTGSGSLALSIGKASQTISFSALSNKAFNAPPFAVSATATSGLAVGLSVLSGPASISDGTVTLSGATGTVTIRASQPGNANYNAATNVDQSFTVTGAVPTISSQPQSMTIALGGGGSFGVTAAGSPPFTYQWRKGGASLSDGSGISGSSSSGLSLTNVQASAAGGYDVVVTNSLGSVTSNSATLTVGAAVAPSITVPPQDTTIAQGGNGSLGVTVTGSAPLTYQWRKGGSPLSDGGGISGASSAGLSFTNVQPTATGNYSVTVTNAVGSVTSGAATLTVGPPALPVITSQPRSVVLLAGATAQFTVAATGLAPLTYQWRKNGAALTNGGKIAGATSTALTITGAQAADVAGYSVVVTNSLGSATSGTASLIIPNDNENLNLLNIHIPLLP